MRRFVLLLLGFAYQGKSQEQRDEFDDLLYTEDLAELKRLERMAFVESSGGEVVGSG